MATNKIVVDVTVANCSIHTLKPTIQNMNGQVNYNTNNKQYYNYYHDIIILRC